MPSFDQLRNAAYLELRKGDLHAAEAQAEEGLRLAREKRDPDWEGEFQALRAEVFVERGRAVDALAVLQTGVMPSGRPAPVFVRMLMTRARAQCLSGGSAEVFRQAAADLSEAGEMAATLGSSVLSAEVIRHRGGCALLRGDYPEAEGCFRESLSMARQNAEPFLQAKAAGNLGLLMVRRRRYDEATEWLGMALELATALQVDLDVVRILTNLGWCYYRLGDYDRALGFLARAQALAEARGFTSERVLALQNLGNAHYRLGDLSRASEDYASALAIARERQHKKLMAELLSNLGIVALEQGRYDEAEVSVREALAIKTEIVDLPGRLHSVHAEGQIWAGRGDSARAEALYRAVLDSPHADRELLWETRAALAELRVKAHRPAEAEAEFRQALAIMEESRSELRLAEHKISFFSSLDRFYDAYVDFLVASGRVREPLEVADRSRARLLRERLGAHAVPAVTAERFQEAARALDAVILFYRLAPGRSFLWTVRPRNVALHVLPAEREIRERVEAHQSLILRSRDPLAEGAPEARWLYRTLVGPATSAIPPGARVVVIPDGPLHQVNFETLVVPDPKERYWIEDVTLATAPSLALLAAGGSPRPGPLARGILIIGDPVSPNAEFPPLAHAAGEIQGIAEQFDPSERTVLSGAQAEPSAYRTADAGRFSYIHFAAHAKASPEIPLDSAIILSARGDAYRLYARDVLGIALQARLVTLSACRSAGSRTFAGEGPVGLAWAFLRAGAGDVVAGLWNVEDASTARLMEDLYRGLRQGQQPATALRGAKLRLLRSSTAYRKPFYWAPFLVYTQAASPSVTASPRAPAGKPR